MTSVGTFPIFQLRFTVKKVQRHLRHLFRIFYWFRHFLVLFCRFTPPPHGLSPASPGSAHNPKARLILQILLSGPLTSCHWNQLATLN